MSERKPFFRRGHVFTDPSDPSQGYKLIADVYSGDPVRANQFIAFGGAKAPEAGAALPDWLARHVTPTKE